MNEEKKTSTSSSKEDAALIQAFQSGDKAAFDELVLKHKDKLFNLCYWLLGDYHEANDSAQETFIKIYRSLKEFKFESTFSTWVYRITVNTCKNRLKSLEYRFKKRMVSLDNPGEQGSDDFSIEIGDESLSPMMELDKKERLMLIKKAINSLPSDKKTVVALRDIEGLSYEEIAHITGFNLGTVKSKLARARMELRKKLRSVI